MSPNDDQCAIPELSRLVDSWHSGSLDDAAHQKLTDLLREHKQARQYFLEQCQIDAELRWRFASQEEIAGTLACQDEGTTRPIAAIILSGMGFRDDPGFPTVFKKIAANEPLAHQWLQLYLTLRACLFLCFPRLSEAEATVKAICEELATHPLDVLTSEQFVHLACEATSRAADRQFRGISGGLAGKMTAIVRRCLDCCEERDLLAIYDSFEACVPRQIPTDMLRLLCMRYLLGQSPQAIAESLQLPESTVRSRLTQARLQIWKSCVGQFEVDTVPGQLRGLSAFTWALDRPEMFVQGSGMDPRHASNERLWRELEAWTASGGEKCRRFLTFAILHESLNRRLSLNHLIEASKTRRDEEFHRVATEMVLRLEHASAPRHRTSETKRRAGPLGASAAWVCATAAALLIAASTAIWWGSHSPQEPSAGLPRADGGAPSAVPIPSEPVPYRPIIAVVKSALLVDGPGSERLQEGDPVYAGERMEFADGIVHLSTVSGSEWVLEGPVALVMKERGEISLFRGKIVGLNKGEGKPLVVETPSARVLDIGTEFGVLVGDDQATSVAVYDGAVELSHVAAGASPGANDVLHVEADFEASVQQGGTLPPKPIRSTHDRGFIRPDEVQLREQQQQGSIEAAKQVAFFELLRVEGLLAYQGFDGPSRGEEYAIGFLPLRAMGPLEFGEDLRTKQVEEPSSASLLLSNGSTVFLDLDVSDRSPLARAGLVNASHFIGGRETTVWLCWRSKSLLVNDRRFQWSGLSLMHGDTRRSQEPVFIGQPAGAAHLGLQIFDGQEEAILPLDTDPSGLGAQTIASDDRSHLWVVRIVNHGDGGGTLSAWCDVDPAKIDSTAPHAEQHVADFKFDRLRLEVSQEGEQGQCAYDEVFLTASLEALEAAIARLHPQAPPHQIPITTR